MDARRRGIQITGWLSLIAGYGLALLLRRGIFMGVSGGFGARPSQALWILLAYLLFFALAIFLFKAGRRALSIAKGCSPPRARFGWGRMLVGAIFIDSYAARQFHLIPARGFKDLEPSNQTQAVAMNVTTIVISVGCLLLIFSGIWRGFRRPPTELSPDA